MVQFFLKYNPYKLFLVFIILLLIRGVAYTIGLPLTDPELTWLLVGERMAEGHTLYKDIWTDLEPFSAGVYYFLHLLFGKSTFVYFIVSLLLVAVQALIFTLGLNENKIFREPTALPALLYVLFSSLFFDFYTLSPVLLGLTFVLMAFRMICIQTRVMSGDDRFFYIGFLTGVASLFYFPFTLFLLFSLVSLGLYSVSNLKKQVVLLLAFCFPHLLVLIYFFWIDNLWNYYEYAWYPLLDLAPLFLIDLPTIVKIIVLPVLLLVASIVSIVARGRYIHYQYKIIKIAGIWLFAGFLALLTEKVISPSLLMIFVPPLTFFASHFFLLSSKNKLISEVIFFAMFGGILLISFYALRKPDPYTKARLIKVVPEEVLRRDIINKRILVLGEEKEYYINNTISGPYVNWRSSRWLFADLKRYEYVSIIYEMFQVSNPEYVIDRDKKMETVSAVIPELKNRYQLIDSTGIYQRKP